MEENYSVKIIESSRELDARGRLAMKDLANAQKFDELEPGAVLAITPVDWAVLKVSNPKAERKEYDVYVVIDSEGNKYYTSSEAFWSAFKAIADEMGDEDFSITVYKCESKNYKGKYFITCSIIWN